VRQKPKPIRDLFYRFIQHTEFEGRVNAQDLALALHNEGRIDLRPHKTEPLIQHYIDSEEFDSLSAEEQRDFALRLMEVL
jgi:phosphomannomutase